MRRWTFVLLALAIFGTTPAVGQDIFAAIESADAALVQGLVNETPSLLNVRGEDGLTPLLAAISNRQPELANWLLDRGADPTLAKDNGVSALHYAALRGFPDLIERLVAAGLDVDIRTLAMSTPLLHASGYGEFEATIKLLELGADTELPNDYGRTPLLNVARESGNTDMARLLVEHGANVDALDRFEDSPLVLASWRGFSGIVDLLLDNGADVPVTGSRGSQLIRYSAERGLDRLMRMLVDRGADLTVTDGQGKTLLHGAATGGSAGITRLLLAEGVSPDAADVYGWTPLHYAAGKGRLAVVEILLGEDVDPEARTLSGHTPLSLAGDHDRAQVVQLLASRSVTDGRRRFPTYTGPYFGQIHPGDEAALFMPDLVSTNWGGHSCVAFSPDGTEAFWTPYRMPADSGYGHSRIVGSRLEDGRWTVPVEPAFASACPGGGDVPVFSHDGNRLYFISTRPFTEGGARQDENIWIVDRTADGWGEAYPAPGELNSVDMHWQFTPTTDGTIYFEGSGVDSHGRSDVYRSRYVDGSYLTPENLGAVINTPSGENSPYIAPDESYLLFSSMGHEGGGDRLAIYISWNDGQGGWTEPVFTGIIGLCPMVTHDGEYLFYRGRGDMGGVRWRPAAFLRDFR